MKYYFYLSILAIFCSLDLSAANVSYIGSNNGSWHNPSNWSNNALPAADDVVYISCNCNVILGGGPDVEIRRVSIFSGSSLRVENNQRLVVVPSGQSGLHVDGNLVNYGEIEVVNPNSVGSVNVHIGSNGLVNNYGQLLVGNTGVGIRINGKLDNQGEILIGLPGYPNNQPIGLDLYGQGELINQAGGEISFRHITSSSITCTSNSSVTNDGMITMESSCTGNGVYNQGYLENKGNIFVRGSTNRGLVNQGELYNDGNFYFFNTASGVAIRNNGASLTNDTNGRIWINGNQYTEGIGLYGNAPNSQIINYGEIDIYTGSAGNHAIYVYASVSELVNLETGTIEVDTRADHALSVLGSVQNLGGAIELNTYGSTLHALTIYGSGELINAECGTLKLEDQYEITYQGQLENHAWMYVSFNNQPNQSSYATFINTGVIHDVHGILAGVSIDNKDGVIVDPLYDVVLPEEPYYNPIQKGSGTNVEINNVFFDWAGNEMGEYYFDQNVLLPDGGLLTDEKYYYMEFRLPDCGGTRMLSMYHWGFGTTLGTPSAPGISANEGIFHADENLQVYPNPAINHLTVSLPNTWTNGGVARLLDFNGRILQSQSFTENTNQLQLQRPQGLPTGTYLLQLIDEAGQVASKKVNFIH